MRLGKSDGIRLIMVCEISKIHANRVPRFGSSKKLLVPILEAQKRHPVPKLKKGTLSSGTSPVFQSMEVGPTTPTPPTRREFSQADEMT